MNRCISLNNPMSIERTGIAWQGESTLQDDPVFLRFETPEKGIRAGMKNLVNYQRLHNLDTIRKIITRYAPPIENNTEAYIADVCKRCGVGPDDHFDDTEPQHLILLAKAVVRHEQGTCPDPTLPFWYDDTVFQQAAKEALA